MPLHRRRKTVRVPNLFIVGAPRCGTTSLYRYLQQHPDIFFSETKEPHFFGRDLTRTGSMYNYTLEEYLDLFSYAGSEKILGEASPHYLFSRTAPEEIFEFNRDSKIIIMLRNPVDMIYSLHSRYLYSGNETESDFLKALELEKQRRKGVHLPGSIDLVEKLFYKEYVRRLPTQIERYLKFFGKDKVQIILFEEFISEPGKICSKVLSFLNIEDHFEFIPSVENPNKVSRSPRVRDILKRTAMPLGRLRSKIRSRPFGLMSYLYRLNSVNRERKPLDNKIKDDLQKEFKPIVRQLEGIVGVNLQEWYL